MKNRYMASLAPLLGILLLLGCSPEQGGAAQADQSASIEAKNEGGMVPKAVWNSGEDKNTKLANYRQAMVEDWPQKNLAIETSRANCAARVRPSYHIRYVTRYPENLNGDPTLPFTDIVPPPISLQGATYRVPMVKDVVVSGDFNWSRSYKATIWEGVDQEWKAEIKEEVRRLDSQFSELQSTNPEQAMAVARQMATLVSMIRTNPVMGTNEDIWHSVEVEAPPSRWSFKYNAETRKGDPLYRREGKGRLNRLAQVLADNPAARDQFTQPIKDLNVQTAGTRTILGQVCDVRSIPGWRSNACFIDIDGEAVSLSSSLDKAERQAVFLDLDPCIPPGFFDPPSTVDFEDEW